jgi:hypothetical protein
MASGYAALTSLTDRRQATQASLHRAMAASELRRQLERWAGGAELTIEDDRVEFRGLDGHYQGLDDDELLLRTNALTTATDPGVTVRLYVDRSDSTLPSGLTLEVRRPRELTARYLELDPAVRALDIRYLSDHFGVRQWGSSWVSSTVLPLAVRLTLGGAAPDSLPELLRLPILIPVRAR